MFTLFVRHKVAEYDTWRSVYDAFDVRDAMGVKEDGVLRHVEDPNDVTVYHVFESRQGAEAFLANPELGAAMQKAGVIGKPEIWLTENE